MDSPSGFLIDSTIFLAKNKRSHFLPAVIISAEEAKTETAVCCMSAAGVDCHATIHDIPRKRVKTDLLTRVLSAQAGCRHSKPTSDKQSPADGEKEDTTSCLYCEVSYN